MVHRRPGFYLHKGRSGLQPGRQFLTVSGLVYISALLCLSYIHELRERDPGYSLDAGASRLSAEPYVVVYSTLNFSYSGNPGWRVEYAEGHNADSDE